MSTTITKAEQRILGFLIAAGGDRNQGSTVRDIQEGTGLSHNTVYLAIRNSVPGVLKCMHHTNTGGAMYYVTADSIRDSVQPVLVTKEIQTAANQTILDSKEWAEVPEEVFGGLSYCIDHEPPSMQRIESLLKQAETFDPDHKDYWYRWAVSLQASAVLALRLAKERLAKESK